MIIPGNAIKFVYGFIDTRLIFPVFTLISPTMTKSPNMGRVSNCYNKCELNSPHEVKFKADDVLAIFDHSNVVVYIHFD